MSGNLIVILTLILPITFLVILFTFLISHPPLLVIVFTFAFSLTGLASGKSREDKHLKGEPLTQL